MHCVRLFKLECDARYIPYEESETPLQLVMVLFNDSYKYNPYEDTELDELFISVVLYVDIEIPCALDELDATPIRLLYGCVIYIPLLFMEL